LAGIDCHCSTDGSLRLKEARSMEEEAVEGREGGCD
jgi:hypothetical protein